MKIRITFIQVLFIVLWFVSAIGAGIATLNVVGSIVGDGDVYNGVVHEVDRNPHFFESSNPTINSLLAVPRYFFKVYFSDDPIFTDHYGTGNIFLGFLSLLVLIACLPFIGLKYNEYKTKNVIIGILMFLYTSYWAFVTVFTLVNLIGGTSFTETFTWS